jgi:Flp pilus assembly protein TadG
LDPADRFILVRRLAGDTQGAVLVEVTITLIIMLVFVFGSIEFLFLFYQWNAASKAVQVGARLAAVSDPVAAGLNTLSSIVINAGFPPGSPMPSFTVTCEGRMGVCSCSGACPPGGFRYSSAAMNTIVFGRASTSCSDATAVSGMGMCDMFSRIAPANVVLTYSQTGLGYAGRPGGPVPTITISLRDLKFRFLFLGGLIGLKDIDMPALQSSITAEDMSSRAPSF